MAVCRYGVISGVVQGVGFRDHVRRIAKQAGLNGFARNLRDGRVEVLLCGEREGVAAAETEIAKGPPSSRVTGVTWEERPYVDMVGFETG